ncbi:uncharacterized protein [Littorina saxatilis]|uniref:EF-hand domain-containing protein n=1 Tax=Littorina saxatilis TaxID=31220 RepID=A0AAN9BMM0_9CAEN
MANLQPPTLCEIKYDEEWEFTDTQPHLRQFRGVSSAKSQPSSRYGAIPGPFPSHPVPSLVDSASVASCTPSFHTYYDYLTNYYWEHPSTGHNGGASTSPTLPVRSQTSLTCCGWYEGEGASGAGRGGDRTHLSLASLSRTGHHGEDWGGEEKKPHPARLKWVDALNAWVPETKPCQRNPFISFINTPPRVERYMYAKEGTRGKHGGWPACECQRFVDHMRLFRYKHSDKHLLLRTLRSSSRRSQEDQRRSPRKSYSSPLYDPETLRKSRTVRFEAPRTASSSPQPMMVPEHIEVPQAVWEDETLLEATQEPGDVMDSKPAAMSSPRPPPKTPPPSPRPPPTPTRPQPKPKSKRGRPVMEKTPKPSKPVEKPPPPPPPKPVRQPKPPPPKPVKQPKPPKPKPEPKEKKKEPVDKPIPLPISPPEEIIVSHEPPEEPPPTQPVVHHRAPVKKKEKLPPPPPRRRTPTPPPKPPTPVNEHKEQGDWIYGSDDEEKTEEVKAKEGEEVRLDLPTLPPALPDPNQAGGPKAGAERGGRNTIAGMPLMALKSRPRWGQKQRDTSLLDEAERERLAEARRRKFAALMDKSKIKRGGDKDQGDISFSDFDDYGFLGKYCIFNQTAREKYRHTFSILDEAGKGFLTEEETALGLGFINANLRDSEITYLFRVLEVLVHRVNDGTDLNMFCILAALSQRVSKLDEWAHCEWARKMMVEMGKLMAETDYNNLERKMFLCKTLWECNVDVSTSTISRDQLLVELRAGGLSPQHETEVLTRLPRSLNTLLPHPDSPSSQAQFLQSLPRSLDFLDFLLYVPLFIMIHETVVTDPLSLHTTAS